MRAERLAQIEAGRNVLAGAMNASRTARQPVGKSFDRRGWVGRLGRKARRPTGNAEAAEATYVAERRETALAVTLVIDSRGRWLERQTLSGLAAGAYWHAGFACALQGQVNKRAQYCDR